jgi:hypothetical protein
MAAAFVVFALYGVFAASARRRVLERLRALACLRSSVGALAAPPAFVERRGARRRIRRHCGERSDEAIQEGNGAGGELVDLSQPRQRRDGIAATEHSIARSPANRRREMMARLACLVVPGVLHQIARRGNEMRCRPLRQPRVRRPRSLLARPPASALSAVGHKHGVNLEYWAPSSRLSSSCRSSSRSEPLDRINDHAAD